MNKHIAILPSFCVGLCVSLLILPLPWVAGWFTAALIHELGHYIALKLLRVQVFGITIGFRGAYMETGCLRPHAEIIAALAGPIAGLCCLITYSFLPLLCVCAFVQSIYNLLPFPNFDGGRVIRVLIGHCLPSQIAERVYRWALLVFSAFLVIVGVYLWLSLKLGPMFLLMFTIPIMNCGIIKIPCKGGKQIVQ